MKKREETEFLSIGAKVKVTHPSFQKFFGIDTIWILDHYNYEKEGKVRYSCHREGDKTLYVFDHSEIRKVA